MQLNSTASTAVADAPPTHAAPGRGATRQPAGRSFRLAWARTPHEVAQSQRLRWRVFAGELGARLQVPTGAPAGHDVDEFDAFCDHLLIRGVGGPQHNEVIGTCRVMSLDGARRVGRFYTASEFDLAPLADLLPTTLELGRMCLDPAWRNGLVVMAVWQEVAQQLTLRGLDAVIGCCSVGLADGGQLASAIWHQYSGTSLSAPGRQVRPLTPLQLQPAGSCGAVQVPALMKGYLRCGGKLLGPPAFDEQFNTADFPMMLRLTDMPARYEKRVFGL